MKITKNHIGKTVHCIIFGQGVITGIDTDDYYPVTVQFLDSASKCYTQDGKYRLDFNTTLGFHPWAIKQTAPRMDTGQACWVRDEEDADWCIRFYVEENEEGCPTFRCAKGEFPQFAWKQYKIIPNFNINSYPK